MGPVDTEHASLPIRLPIQLPIQERFVSVQGEGLLVGTPSTFIRVSGCNLRCVWCDSPASSWAPERSNVPLSELLEFCEAGPPHVVLTGGEPMMFPSMVPLAKALRAAGRHVTIETAGTRWLGDLECDLMSISPKLAHSTPWRRHERWARQHERLRLQPELLNRLLEAHPWQLKFVVRAHDGSALRQDLVEVDALVERLGIHGRSRDRVLLMPEGTERNRLNADYANLIQVCATRGFRVGQRLHIAMFGHTPGT